jgi:DNA-binding NarL/FixJ family response regulator
MTEIATPALAARGLEVVPVRWPTSPEEPSVAHQVRESGADVAVLLYELEAGERMAVATSLLRSSPTRWLVLSGPGPCPTWGGVLEAGASSVLPNATGLDSLVEAVTDLAQGRCRPSAIERAELVFQWNGAEPPVVAPPQPVRSASLAL